MKTLVSFLKDERGLETVEWAVVAALIVVALIAVFQAIGTKAAAKLETLSTNLN